VCFSDEQIVYKQVRTPALMSAHTGRWGFEHAGDRTLITSAHTVVIRPEAVHSVLGAGATVNDARAFVRAALSRNSTATMLAAKAYAERRRQTV
jgi:aromatase/bifunctional aromatase (cyclase/dehydratase)